MPRDREDRIRPRDRVGRRNPPPSPGDITDVGLNPNDYKWPGPQPWYGQGPTPADLLFERGTKGWKQALDPRRKWVGDELWKAHVGRGLNLSDKQAVSDFLRGLDITDEVGGGRHLRNLFLGNLPSEGFGMSPIRDIPWAQERYMPEWKQSFDRSVQGGHLIPDRETGLYVNPGRDIENPEWYNSFGQRVNAPYAGKWKTQQERDYERQMFEQESKAQPITFAPQTATPAITSPAPVTTTPAITGYDTSQQQNKGQQPFYTSPTPPSIGVSFNMQPNQQKKQPKPTIAQPKPAAGWVGTWS